MGAALETPAQCPLCNQMTREPVVLKCNHRFCQRCIGDLWSVSPNGPFRCPVWRCETNYQTQPFDSTLLWPPKSSQRLSTPSTTGTSTKDPTTSVSPLTRPLLASRLLGKRKGSAPSAEQPDTKRLSTSERSAVNETPINSLFEKAERLPSVEATGNELNSEWDGGTTSSDDSFAQHIGDVPQGSSQQPNSAERVELDDSDCYTEVDLCSVPPLETPQQDLQVPSSSPPNRHSFTAASTSQLSLSPVHDENKSPMMLPKHAAVASGSPSRIGIFAQPKRRNTGPVPCHYCPKTVHQSAVKTCLVCGASMCPEHLRPHVESPVFQNHTLVPPTEDVSVWRCQEHQEINRIYCRQCAACVCTVCTVIGSHRGHVCISIREAEQELRGNLKEDINQLQRLEQQVKDRVTEFTKKEEAFREVLSKARSGVCQQYAAIREALQQEEQSALRCVEQEESKVVGSLEEKLSYLHNSLQSIQEGLHTLETLVDAKGENLIRDQAFIMEYSKVPRLDMETCLHQLEAPEEANEARLKCLQRWTENRLNTVVISEPSEDRDLYVVLYGTVPILDANTAHPKLQLSDKNRRVTYTAAQQAFVDQDARFSAFPQVLANRGFRGGRWYWEVDLPADEGRWKVGLCEAHMERKGQRDSSRLGFNASSWCLACDRRKLEVLHNKVGTPVTTDRLQRVGVFLDYDEGILTFFNATPGGSLAPMHFYKHTFTGRLYPALSVSKTQLVICDVFEP
ncbi:E3 ubiquitin/ISG15 ligase TRIM25 [Phyllopteryx taeniolatus]|uniref:E3 ubiquitin/ISG15 ligase TRIM25 n=1 Tax=Phyllopteryx taeniolatus TaxID=161469 RepID=UPI002AD4B971|nr:E3 ubiquitin/ISG15 ligase TRIM25 [Phyllopteryx taeniolatus]